MHDKQQSLEQRLGRIHARQRLGIEAEVGHRVFGNGLNYFHPENWYGAHSVIKFIIRLSGMYQRGIRNACNIQVRVNELPISGLAEVFSDYTVLQLSDLHVDMYEPSFNALLELLPTLQYDLCVMTGDYRAATYGDIENSISGMQRVLETLKTPVYGVLGNHDSVTMLPELESLGMRILMNESVEINRDGQYLYLCGVDDAHYFRVENIADALADVPVDSPSILLSHTPEIYRQVAHAGVTVMLCGHTHGGQICLPGGIPLTLDARCPRYMGKGAWQYAGLQGFTSVGCGTSIVNVRYNCLPEVVLHRLRTEPPAH